MARALALEAGSGMEKSGSPRIFAWVFVPRLGLLCCICRVAALASALRELAALHVIKFLTCHSPSLAPGMAA